MQVELENCRNCIFFRCDFPQSDEDYKVSGACVRYPPTRFNNLHGWPEFPRVNTEVYCGEWKINPLKEKKNNSWQTQGE